MGETNCQFRLADIAVESCEIDSVEKGIALCAVPKRKYSSAIYFRDFRRDPLQRVFETTFFAKGRCVKQ